jgi:hypothetical protein
MMGLLFVGSEKTLWIAFPLVFLATLVLNDKARAGESSYGGLARGQAHHARTALEGEAQPLSSVRVGLDARRERRSVTLRKSSLDCRIEGLSRSPSNPGR